MPTPFPPVRMVDILPLAPRRALFLASSIFSSSLVSGSAGGAGAAGGGAALTFGFENNVVMKNPLSLFVLHFPNKSQDV